MKHCPYSPRLLRVIRRDRTKLTHEIDWVMSLLIWWKHVGELHMLQECLWICMLLSCVLHWAWLLGNSNDLVCQFR